MFSEVVAGVLLGYGIDYWLGTRNRWIVVGAIAGIVVAMATVMRTAMRLGAKPSLPRGTRTGAAEHAGSSGRDGSPASSSPSASASTSEAPPAPPRRDESAR